MQKTKALSWLFPENIRRVGKQVDSYFWGGGCSGNSRGNPWSLIMSLRFVRLPSTWPCHRRDFSCWPPTQVFHITGRFFTSWARKSKECREPVWGIPPVTRSCGKSSDGKANQTSGFPNKKTKICWLLCSAFPLFWYSLEKSQLRALVCIWKGCFS